MPASASTASSTKTGISTRTARAIASEGRADTVVPSSKASSPKKVPSRKSTTRTCDTDRPSAVMTWPSRSWVSGRVGRTPC